MFFTILYRKILIFLKEKRCASVSVEVPKSQHKYVLGPKGSTINEILQLTGVSVEIPAADSSVGTITLRGPQDKLGVGEKINNNFNFL